MRKNQSKYKNPMYIKSLINNALTFDNVSYIENKDYYVYFNCSKHGEFKKTI